MEAINHPWIWTSDLADPDPEPLGHRWLPSVSKKHIWMEVCRSMCMLGKQSLWSKGMFQNITLLILEIQYICMQFANLCTIQLEHYVRNDIPQCTAAQTDVPWISTTMLFWLIIWSDCKIKIFTQNWIKVPLLWIFFKLPFMWVTQL